jgi:hypothetical protein
MTTCLLCGCELTPRDDGLQDHPEDEACLVRLTDEFGVAVDEPPQQVEVAETSFEDFDIRLWPLVDVVLADIFKDVGLQRLGGASSGRGWTSFSIWQRCPYLWKKRYIDPPEPSIIPLQDPAARAAGTLIHTFLATFYQRMIVPDYPLTPDVIKAKLLERANPEIVNDAWAAFLNYAIYYQDETIWPLAVEYDLRDPRNGESCRYDLIAFFPETVHDRPPGTYILEHKSSERFDDNFLNGWANDGEVLGQVMLWERLGLDKRFGPLKGVIMNLVGRQKKEPKVHRTTVAPSFWQVEQHREDLKRHEAMTQLSIAHGVFPRSRANCINRYGKCDLFEHCITGD